MGNIPAAIEQGVHNVSNSVNNFFSGIGDFFSGLVSTASSNSRGGGRFEITGSKSGISKTTVAEEPDKVDPLDAGETLEMLYIVYDPSIDGSNLAEGILIFSDLMTDFVDVLSSSEKSNENDQNTMITTYRGID
jgi:hypothetical protein